MGFSYTSLGFYHKSSDLDETWWKLFQGVSRSVLNSSGTKTTAKNTKKHEIQNFKKIENSKFADSGHAQLSIYVVFHEESEFQVKIKQFRRPEANNFEKRQTKFSLLTLF